MCLTPSVVHIAYGIMLQTFIENIDCRILIPHSSPYDAGVVHAQIESIKLQVSRESCFWHAGEVVAVAKVEPVL